MLKREKFSIETIYVPVRRRGTLDLKRVEEIAESMLVNGQTTPILVRPDGARFVLVEGLHRLEAARALGEQTIVSFRVAARKNLIAREICPALGIKRALSLSASGEKRTSRRFVGLAGRTVLKKPNSI